MIGHRLRIMHNGHVFQNNPHWHLWIYDNGDFRGEIIGRQSDFKCIQSIQKRLSDSDISTLFAEAKAMRPHFKQREKICLPDDVMVELNENTDGKTTTLFWYVIPLEDYDNPAASAFLQIVHQIFEPYA
jgi:hypothetical protein